MKRLFIAIAFLITICQDAVSQHGAGYITYDTTFNLGYAGITIRLRVTRPQDYFSNYPDSLQLLLFMPGQGQNGTSYSTLDDFGIHYWLANGWDGGVPLANGTHYPLLITMISSKVTHTGYEHFLAKQLIYARFHPKMRARHFAGLSQGAIAESASLLYEATPGSEDGMKLTTSAVFLQGRGEEIVVNTFGQRRLWGRWAKKYNGRAFCLEGTNDTSRETWRIQQSMDDSLAGLAYFAYENIGGGTHCCWNTMMDPSRTNWTSVGTLGPNITTGGFPPNPNKMGTYQTGWSIVQWMMRQGDTTLITGGGGSNEAPSANAGTDQSITLPSNQVTLSGSGTDADGSISSYAWTKQSGGAATITSASSASTTVTGLAAGSYVFRLTVTDNGGLTAFDDVNVTVNSASNQPPTVNAGTDKSITLPTNSTTLIGVASDVETATGSLTLLWTKISGGAATITASSNDTTNITGLEAGTYTFRFTATDEGGLSSSDDVTVIVNVATGPKKITWSNTQTNIVINERFAGSLTVGDSVIIPIRTGGYRSITIDTVDADADETYVHVYFQPGAYITPSSSSLQANYLRSSRGVKITGMEMDNHTDVVFRLAGYSSYIWIDSLSNRNSRGMGNSYTGIHADFAGDSLNAFRNWTFSNCVFDSLFNNGTGGIAISTGKVAANGYWLNTTIRNNYFNNYRSTDGNPSKYIDFTGCFNCLIENNYIGNLGVVPNPTGHASAINGSTGKITVRNNYAYNNFGNIVRGSFGDLPSLGGNYVGRSIITNNISLGSRKYGFADPRPTSGATLSAMTHVRNRVAEYSHITVVNPGVGAGGNSPYQTAIVDFYGQDTLVLKNSVLVSVKDTTWGTAYGPFMYTASVGPISIIDTAGNRLIQLWSNAGLADSVNFIPTTNGALYNNGTTPPAYVTTDYYGNSRTIGGGTDIGAVEKVVSTPPVAQIQGGNRTVSVAAGLTLVSTSYDSDGSLTGFLWEKVSGPSVTINSATSASTTIGGLTAGTYVFRLRVTDNSGSQSFADVTITVQASTGRNWIRYYNRPKKGF